MSLRSIHETKKLQNEPENSSDSQLIEEQSGLIQELQRQISELSSTNSTLKSELQKRSETIRSLNEQIGKLSESDNVLKQNDWLKKQNARLEREKKDIIQEADDLAWSYKADYEQKCMELSNQKKRAEQMEQEAKTTIERQQTLIREKADSMIQDERTRLEHVYRAKMGSLLYGILCTLFTAVRSETFVSDFKAFLNVIWKLVWQCADGVLRGAKWAAQIGDLIPQPTVGFIIHWLIQIAIVVAAVVIASVILMMGYVNLYEDYKENFADQISLAELLISFAVLVFFAEPIREVVPVNLILILILIHVLYLGIRKYLKVWRRDGWYS